MSSGGHIAYYTIQVYDISLLAELIPCLAMTWLCAHLPFLLGFSLAGASLSKLVVATDCANGDLDNLTETYMRKSSDHIDIGLRWFYCGGLGIALISMGKKP